MSLFKSAFLNLQSAILYVRLAFAVAALGSAERSRRSLEPETMLVNEVLVVQNASKMIG
ncbi:MAG: hypothetical protein KJ606_02090 [Chloroflexi bacterium]|nr:hypothetical protein [Chloroflexota bacterium]